MSDAEPVNDPALVAFADVQRSMSIFAEGIAGTFVHLKTNEAANVHPRTRTRSPFHANDEAIVVNLPAELSTFPTRAWNRRAYRVAVLHQLACFEHGTYTLDLHEFVGSAANPELLRKVFTILEDLRIDTKLRQEYAGIDCDLDRVRSHTLAGQRARSSTVRQSPTDAAHLLELLTQFSLGADSVELQRLWTDEARGLAATVIELAATVTKSAATVHDTARAALRIVALIEAHDPERKPTGPGTTTDDENGTTGTASDDADSENTDSDEPDRPVGGRPDADPDFLVIADDDLQGTGIDFRGEPDPGDGTHRGRSSGPDSDANEQHEPTDGEPPGSKPSGSLERTPDADDRNDGAQGPLPPVSRRAAPQPTANSTRTYFYDEWNYLSKSYERAWCRLHEHRLHGNDYGFITDVRRRHSFLAGRVRRHFGSIRPEAWQRIHRTPDGDELGIDSVVEAVIDRRSGHATDEQLYIRRDRATRDVAAAFLLDMSRSTDSPVDDPNEPPPSPKPDPSERDLYARGGYFDFDFDITPAAPKRRVIDVAKESLALMCDALQTLGDSHAVYGFSGSGRLNVEFHVAKEFGDRTSPRTWAAVAAMEPIRYTRMGPPIRHCVAKLSAQPERTKVLVVVTDGYPQDEDYGPNRNDREYGIHDTARAIDEAERAGISTFCVTVDPAGNDYLRRMCAPDRYLVIDDVVALPGELEKVYRRLTGR